MYSFNANNTKQYDMNVMKISNTKIQNQKEEFESI